MSYHIDLQGKIDENPRKIYQNSERKIDLNVIILPNKIRWMLFFLMICISILSSIDHGTIPAATVQIKIDLNISDTILGLFGSAVYAGTILGGLILISLINVSNRKYVLLTSIVSSGVCLILFTIKQHYVLLFINRGIVGMFQVFLSVYFPVWADQYGEENKKTMMFAMIQLCSPLGIVLGYALTTVFSHNYGWKISLLIEGISIISLALILGLFSKIYFKSSIRQHKSLEDKSTYFYDEEVSNQGNETNGHLKEEKGIFTLFKQLKEIFKEPIYIFSILSLSTLLYIATCIQYWASDYMLDTLGIEDPKIRLAAFAIICLTSASFGVILIGLVITWYGGYESKNSTPICLCFCILLCICSIPIPFVDNLFWCAFILWLLLFFGGGIIAPLSGIIITSVPKKYAGSANSICILSYNLIGKLPAPYIYGIIKTHSSGRIAMMTSMWFSLVSVAFLSITTFLRSKHYARIQRYSILIDNLKHNIETNTNKIELSDRNPNGDRLDEAMNSNEINKDVVKSNSKGYNTGVSVV